MPLNATLVTYAVVLVLALACSGDGNDDSGTGTSGAGGEGNVVDMPASGGVAGAELASSGGTVSGATGDDRLFVPAELQVSNLSGEGQAVNVVASTLRDGADGPELYAAVRNSGEITACDAAISFELFDESEQSVGSWIGGLYSEKLFRRGDDSGGLVACIEPGDTAMVSLTELAEGIVIDELGYAVYQLTYFDRDILPFELIPVDALAVTSVRRISRGSVSAFGGVFENRLDVVVNEPSVTIFPVNRVGRPLGVATSSAPEAVPPGGSWSFETTTVEEPGVDHVAYPRGSVSFTP